MAECYAADWEVTCLLTRRSSDGSTKLGLDKTCSSISTQGCALAAHGEPWRQTFAPGRPENHIQGTLDFTGSVHSLQFLLEESLPKPFRFSELYWGCPLAQSKFS